jgi:amino acid adenylation domain-containing protein
MTDSARIVERATRTAPPAITPAERGGPLPLSFAQRRLWFLAQMGVGEAYHIFCGWRLKGQLDHGSLQQALDRIIGRHEALRATFISVEGDPKQCIHSADESRFHLIEHDLQGLMNVQEELDRVVKQEASASFDLERGPLIRGRLIRLGGKEHALLITMHHIVSDGWSQDVLIGELSALYGAFVRGEEDPLPELIVQYADYAVWQHKWMGGEILQKQAEYWEKALAGIPSLLELPTDHVRPREQDYTGGRVTLELEERLTRELKELSKRHRVTLYMTLLAGWGTLLSQLSGQEEIVIGTPMANRGRVEIEGLIGFFVSTLALRLDLSGSPSVVELLRRVKERTLEAQQNQDIPFDRVVEIARPARSLSHNPLFQVMFEWQQGDGEGRLALPGLEVDRVESAHVVAQFDLSLSLRDIGERIVGGLEYATSLYERSTVERYLGCLRALLGGMVKEEARAIDLLCLLPEVERHQLLYEWNATQAEYPREKCIHELFEQQVEKTPDAVAVVFEDANLSYRELNRRANQLAHYLRGLGVGPDERVGMCAERSLEIVVGLLAVLKAGGAYVPLDPAYPAERLQYMTSDIAPVAMLTRRQEAVVFSGDEWPTVLNLEDEDPPWRKESENNLDCLQVGLKTEHLAYVIYTSSSTGIAEGVMVEHGQLVNYVAAVSKKLELREKMSYGLISTFAADLGNTMLFPSLVLGGRLNVLSSKESMNGDWFGRYCLERRIDYLKITPTHFQALLGEEAGEEQVPCKCLVFGGEALSWELVVRVQSLRPECRIYNHYGNTESTVGALSEEARQIEGIVDNGLVALGRPMCNVGVYVLNRQGKVMPVGVMGEIYIGGSGVARGYLNRPELTGERFVIDPFARKGGSRMYKTGDMGRWRADGTVEFLGRNDFQVEKS